MNNRESVNKYTNDLKFAIGSFVFHFEHLVLQMRLYLLTLFPDRENHGYLGRMFIPGLSFDQMVQKIKQINAHHLEGKPEYVDLLDVRNLIIDTCSLLSKNRNDIVHGAWIINHHQLFGEPIPENPTSAVMRKPSDLKGDFVFLQYSVDDINTLATLIQKMTAHFVTVYHPVEGRKEFYIDDDELRSIKAQIQQMNERITRPKGKKG